jgi:hypothetical protein
MTDKEKYIIFCNNEKTIPIFSQYFWLDAVCGSENWNVCLAYNKNDEIIGTLPYYINKKHGFRRLSLPKLTQKLGPWIKYPSGQKAETKLSYELKICNELISRLPKNNEFIQNFDHTITNWLPFHWKGYKQTTRYTYRLSEIQKLDSIYNEFKGNIKREIKKAEKKGINIVIDDDIKLFYKINKKTFDRQKKKIPYIFEFIENLDNTIKDHRIIFFAKDSENRIHAAIYVIWDNDCAYYLMGGGDPELRNSGATSLLMWHAIREMSTKVKYFDFEGSMIEPIERFFRAFGSSQTPYFQVSKVFSKRLKLIYFLKDLIKK